MYAFVRSLSVGSIKRIIDASTVSDTLVNVGYTMVLSTFVDGDGERIHNYNKDYFVYTVNVRYMYRVLVWRNFLIFLGSLSCISVDSSFLHTSAHPHFYKLHIRNSRVQHNSTHARLVIAK